MPAKKTTKPQRDFEASVKRLDAIVQEMEAGGLKLEDMIARFEEGQALIAFCTEKLNEVERKVDVLIKKGQKTEERPFDDAAPDDNGELF